MKAEELVGVEGRQQPGPGAKAKTVPKRRREGRNGGRRKAQGIGLPAPRQ